MDTKQAKLIMCDFKYIFQRIILEDLSDSYSLVINSIDHRISKLLKIKNIEKNRGNPWFLLSILKQKLNIINTTFDFNKINFKIARRSTLPQPHVLFKTLFNVAKAHLNYFDIAFHFIEKNKTIKPNTGLKNEIVSFNEVKTQKKEKLIEKANFHIKALKNAQDKK